MVVLPPILLLAFAVVANVVKNVNVVNVKTYKDSSNGRVLVMMEF